MWVHPRVWGILGQDMMKVFWGLVTLGLLVATPASACDESCLLDVASDYLDGLTANDPSEVALAPNLRSTENGVETPIGEGLWQTATGWTYRHTIADPVNGTVVTLGALHEGVDGEGAPKEVMTAVRLKVTDRKISESELLVTRKDDFALFRPSALGDADPIFDRVEPSETRSTRADLEGLARGYFEALIWGDPKKTKFHPDCNRVENGVQTSNQPQRGLASCQESMRRFAYMHKYRDVRFPVVDEKRGLVLAVAIFDMPPQNRTLMVRGKPFQVTPERNRLPRSLYLYELFKVENGRIKRIEAVLHNLPLGADMGWGGERGNESPLE